MVEPLRPSGGSSGCYCSASWDVVGHLEAILKQSWVSQGPCLGSSWQSARSYKGPRDISGQNTKIDVLHWFSCTFMASWGQTGNLAGTFQILESSPEGHPACHHNPAPAAAGSWQTSAPKLNLPENHQGYRSCNTLRALSSPLQKLYQRDPN